MKQALMDHSVSVNFPSVMSGFINELPETDETRAEDMIPCALLEVAGSVKEGVPDEGAISDAEICIQNVVSSLGNMADDTEDPKRAAAGKELYERMLQNVLFFLNRREDWSAITDGICDVIELAVKKGGRHYYWLITFFSYDLVKHLVQRSEKERNIAIRIEICTVRALFRKGKEDRFAEWTDGEKKRHLLLEQYIMKMLTDLIGMMASGKMKYGRHGFRYESILNDVDEYRVQMSRWFPDSFIVAYRTANISAHQAMREAMLQRPSCNRYVIKAEKDSDRILKVRDDSKSAEEKKLFYAALLTTLTRVHLYIAREALLREQHHLREAGRLSEKALAASEAGRDDPKNQDVWLSAVQLRGRALRKMKEEKQAATLLWKIYSQLEGTADIRPKARDVLAAIGIDLGLIMLYGHNPEGVSDRSPLLDAIIAREESYYASAPQDSRIYRYHWLELQMFKLVRLPDGRTVEKHDACLRLLPAFKELKGTVWNEEDYDQTDVESSIVFIQKLADETEKQIAGNRPYYLMKQGEYLRQRNPQEAAVLLIEAAEAGNPFAQYYLGNAFYKGRGVEKDRTKALALFWKAAESGVREAQYNLGIMLCNGISCERDREEGIKWLRKALEAGYSSAKEVLAEQEKALQIEKRKKELQDTSNNAADILKRIEK